MDISTQTNGIVDALVNSMLTTIVDQIKTQVTQQVLTELRIQLNEINLEQTVHDAVKKCVAESVSNFDFPEASIPGTAIDTTTLPVLAANIKPGIIKNFSSTGIEDQASTCQVTILDDFTVIENKLITADLTIKGTATIEGDLIVRGEIPTDSYFFQALKTHSVAAVQESIDQDLFKDFSNFVFDKIKSEGVDIKKLSVNGKTVVDGNKLSSSITESNLQKVGVLKELQTQGETYLAQTLYTVNRRVGVNTTEPSHALTVWDDEVEIVAAKQKKDTAVFGTVRNQQLILSSGGKENITLMPDGATRIEKLDLGQVTLSSASTPPSNDQPKGTIIFNGSPSLGGPLGWVSLGGARWANFGIIE